MKKKAVSVMGVATVALAISMAFVGCDGTGSGSGTGNLATLKIVNETDKTLVVDFSYSYMNIVGKVPANSTKSSTTGVSSGYMWADDFTVIDWNNSSNSGFPWFSTYSTNKGMTALRPGFTTTITIRGQDNFTVDNPPKP